jgi:hypothetical protein
MNPVDALQSLNALAALLPAIQESLKERAVQQAVDGGAAVAVRPWSFRHPMKGETDPWFGLAYHEWLEMRHEGFKGVYSVGRVESGRAKLFIIFDRAAEWLAAMAEKQAAMEVDRRAATAHLRAARGEEAA